MKTYTKCIILNAGTETRRAFKEGLGDLPYERYSTKYMALHIRETGTPHFLYKNKTVDWDEACVFTRLRSNDQQFCGILYDYFIHKKIPANDPINHSYFQSAEKISQMLLLTLAGIRIPETFIFREESFLANQSYIEAHLSFPCIYKTDGSKGRNVQYVETIEDLRTLIAKKKAHALALIQPFIPNTFDTRTIVAFGEILGSIKRTRTHGYLNNIAQGAIATTYVLDKDTCIVAKKSAEICSIDVAGVDIIHTEDGPMVLEVNKSPQVAGFEKVHNFKVFSKVALLMQKKFEQEYLQ